MTHLSRNVRRGFTMLEIIIALVIFAIVGAAMTKLLLSQNTSYARDVSNRRARSGARSAMNVLISDLRMGQDVNGVAVANDSTLTIYAPVLFGIICAVDLTGTTIATVAPDSFVYAQSAYAGYGVRSPSAPYSYTIVAAGATGAKTTVAKTACSGLANPIRPDTIRQNGDTGFVFKLTPATALVVANTAVGQPAFTFQYLTYKFRASTTYPSARALYREYCGGALLAANCTSEEIMAPFNSAARFNYYTQPSTSNPQDTAMMTPPAVASIRGVEVVLSATAPDTVRGSRGPATSVTRTSIFFKNTVNP